MLQYVQKSAMAQQFLPTASVARRGARLLLPCSLWGKMHPSYGVLESLSDRGWE